MKKHHQQALLDQETLNNKIVEENITWIAKQMLGNEGEREIIINKINGEQ